MFQVHLRLGLGRILSHLGPHAAPRPGAGHPGDSWSGRKRDVYAVQSRTRLLSEYYEQLTVFPPNKVYSLRGPLNKGTRERHRCVTTRLSLQRPPVFTR